MIYWFYHCSNGKFFLHKKRKTNLIISCKAITIKMQINGRMREREKKNIYDIEFQYVRSMSHLIKDSVIKHQY